MGKEKKRRARKRGSESVKKSPEFWKASFIYRGWDASKN